MGGAEKDGPRAEGANAHGHEHVLVQREHFGPRHLLKERLHPPSHKSGAGGVRQQMGIPRRTVPSTCAAAAP
jgi:hypothetical protein